MPYRLTKIYTRKGDKGTTKIGSQRIPKDDALIEMLGTIDELNSSIGLIIANKIENKSIENKLKQIQNDLFNFGGELYLPEHPVITNQHVEALEHILDEWNASLPSLKDFLLPGGNVKSATAHLARTICRRAERCLVTLNRKTVLKNPEMMRYLNRLSDLLFVIARLLAQETQEKEQIWQHNHEKIKE